MTTRPKFPFFIISPPSQLNSFANPLLLNRKFKLSCASSLNNSSKRVLMAFQQTPLSDPPVDTSLNTNAKSVTENSTGFCECNICLESARDPVVTLCGHLYCWPCIYKWLQAETDKQPNCPVCKAHISTSSLVPLYGRGNTPSSNEPETELKRAHQSELVIPNRPPAPGGSVLHLNQQIHPVPFPGQPQPHAHPFGSYAFGPSNPGGPMTATSFSNPIVGMVGEMVCGMIFRSSDSGYFTAYPHGPYQNPYPVPGAGTPRVRRQVMQVEKSLNRLTIFLFFCFVLCFLLF
ncbi:putative transcription factor C2H2 family [Helianthus annuus]|nr:putative transcription factor C2H2 family [Helianthus annuus]KAJ0664090.1 putative transcription factor C2H2 family [Helianthus annuus]KAJ0671571.1 putative transcription factor C2H2 family [Helianthus annuus]